MNLLAACHKGQVPVAAVVLAKSISFLGGGNFLVYTVHSSKRVSFPCPEPDISVFLFHLIFQLGLHFFEISVIEM